MTGLELEIKILEIIALIDLCFFQMVGVHEMLPILDTLQSYHLLTIQGIKESGITIG